MPLAVEPVVGNPSGTVRGRVYVFHGIRDWPASFASTPPFSTLINGLVADGWQTVTVGELYDGSSQSDLSEAHFDGDATKGASFREDVVALFEDTQTYVNATYGAPAGGKEVLLGISWGGLMIHLIASSSGQEFRGYVTHVAASCPPYMTEFLGDDLTELYPSPLTLPAFGPAWISYSTSDTRVGYLDAYGCENTKTIADTWATQNPAVTIRGGAGDSHYIAQGHTLDSTNIADIRAWMATVPPFTYAEGYGNTVSAGYGSATAEAAQGSILVLPSSSAWEQVDTSIFVRTVNEPSTVTATVSGTAGGLLRFRGTDADLFSASLDGATWAPHVDIPAGTSTVHLRVTPEAPGTTLSAEIGVPV